jgi:hypothetical protein
VLAVAAAAACVAAPRSDAAPILSDAIRAALDTKPYVYIASTRKDGTFGTPAEIWFMWHEGAVVVASPITTWRVRRIRAGRTRARIAVGAVAGPRFEATGSIVKDEKLSEAMCRTFAQKYADGWPRWEARFRAGLADGTRVLIKYEPRD